MKKEIKERFNEIKEKNPYWSSWTCFVNIIKDKKFTQSLINRLFGELVDKEDYNKAEKRQLLKYLFSVSQNL